MNRLISIGEVRLAFGLIVSPGHPPLRGVER